MRQRQSSRHTPCAVTAPECGFQSMGTVRTPSGRHTECACYFIRFAIALLLILSVKRA